MGNCFQGGEMDPEEREARNNSKIIERNIRDEHEEFSSIIRILLLGTGDAGKSTFAKQMKVVYKEGFTDSELNKFKVVCRQNAIDTILTILMHCENENIDLSKERKRIDKIQNCEALTPSIASDISKLWNNKALVKEFYTSRDIIQVTSSAAYYLEHAKRFSKEDFIPNTEDILRAKMRTTGIHETQWVCQSTNFQLIDVGGQRSERRKWLHCFDNVTSVIFLCALDEYNLVCRTCGIVALLTKYRY
eukprot:TRINITY_DN381_c0_g1_i1.p1 TRINITY_DN381_c0_g1~~TRINITY_DN381_c0_g1_i1.p1  ORF type:complete len:247 (-),score=39.27 TRINITY_DN381_c0_g1_i1:431-1171(-)